MKAPPRWGRRKDERPGELVAAALQLFAEKGFAATRLEDVAAAAGVSKGTVYLYFESKEQLFEAVVRAAITPNIDRAEQLLASHDGPTPELVRALADFFLPILDTPVTGVIKLIMAESGNFPQLARLYADLVVGRGLNLVWKMIARGVERGEFRPVDPAAMAPVFMAPILLLALWKHSFGAHTSLVLDRAAVLQNHVETLLRGLAAHPGPLPGPASEARSPRS